MLRSGTIALLFLSSIAPAGQLPRCPPTYKQPLVVNADWLVAHRDYVIGLPSGGRGTPGPPAPGAIHDNGCTGLVVFQASGKPVAAAREVVDLEKAGWRGRVSLLDGGLTAWRAARSAIAAAVAGNDGHSTPAPRGYDVRGIVGLEYVRAHLGALHTSLVDARTHDLFTGAALEGPERRGHIPGAVNIPYTDVLASDGALLAKEELREVFARAGVPAGNLVIVYCHSGNKAALVYLAARWAGINAELYEGSWVERSRETELPAEIGDR